MSKTVLRFEKKNNIKNMPIVLEKDNKGKCIPKNPSKYNTMKAFESLTPEESKKMYKTLDTDFFASDTSKYHRIDVDNLELFKNIIDINLLGSTPQYLSRNKRLPHYYVKIINCNEKNFRIPIKTLNENGEEELAADILMGQWAWIRKDENIINRKNKIVEIDYNLFKTKQNKSKPEKRKKRKNNIQNEEQTEVQTEVQTQVTETITKPKYDIDEIKELMNCIDISKLNKYDRWLTIGMILHTIDKDNLKIIWDEYSQKTDCYDKQELDNKWLSFDDNKDRKINYGSLVYYAELDNPKQYKLYKLRKVIEKALSVLDSDIAEIFEFLYSDKYICASEDPKVIWYKYEYGIWEKINGNSMIKKIYSVNIFKKVKYFYMKLKDKYNIFVNDLIIKYGEADLKKLSKLLSKKEEEKFEELSYKMTNYPRLLESLKTNSCLNAIISHSIFRFKDSKFEEKLNSNRYLICFGEHSYDLDKCKWRETKREDYCSIQVGYNVDLVTDEYLKDIESMLGDMFPNKEVYKYVIYYLAELLSGDNQKEIFHLWMGNGANGKSLLSLYLKHVFGEYFSELPVNLVTDKRCSSSKANPELARSRYSRVVMFSEPEKGSKLNNSIMKELSGGDIISTRELYGSPFQFIPNFTCIIMANDFEMQSSEDDSMKRRLLFTKFKTSFVDKPTKAHQKKRNYKLKRKDYIEKVKGSFMYLLINKWEELAKKNFEYSIPECMVNDAKEFIDDNNTITNYIKDCIEITESDDDFIKLKEMYADYIDYCKDNNDKSEKKNVFLKKCQADLPEFKKSYRSNKKDNPFHYSNVFMKCKFKDENEINNGDNNYDL